ncbi:chaperone protein DnaJ [Calliphora vicina]|uniref:chaperone protein DnaJ n=1 Tax=Calliphora vicina TaxID=7373 RepID=UPI00325AA249
MKLMFNPFSRTFLLQNFLIFNKIQCATVAYQFKVNKPIYYPNRQMEMQRMEEQQKSQLVAEPEENKQLPKDYYYKVLGVPKTASLQQIKAAYYALAKRYHPDLLNLENAPQQVSKRFQEISNAYNVLTDESTRLEYDELGEIKDEESFFNKVSKSGNKLLNTTTNKLKEFMGFTDTNTLMNASKNEATPQINNNIEQKLDITFIESVHGVKRNIEFAYLKKCPSCNGKSQRLVGRTNSELCRKCNGSGQLSKKTATYTSLTVCDQCQGKRYINRNQCELCDSRGLVQESTRVTVHVPAGVKTGDVISGENPNTKQRINYRLQVKESDYYKRVGNNVVTERYLNLTEAILGACIKVRGIYDTFDVKIEPGTESHTKITVKGRGIKGRDNVGDHIVTIKVRIPRQLTMKQRQLILALAKTEDQTFERGF